MRAKTPPGQDALNPQVELVGVRKLYRDADAEVEALAGVDLEVYPGEFVAIMGPSGCGKSTLLQLVGGLDTPTAGSVRVGGVDVATLAAAALAEFRRHAVGFVFQAYNLLPNLTVRENVALPAVLAGQSRGRYGPIVDDLIGNFGLAAKADRPAGRLSGGEQQRVAIARAVVMQPSVILADEPTGNLDSASGATVLDLLSRCHAQGQTILLVTHDAVVASQSERILHMRDGRFVEQSHLYRPGATPGVKDLIRTGETAPPRVASTDS